MADHDPAAAERAAFEAWAESVGKNVKTWGQAFPDTKWLRDRTRTSYITSEANERWEAWQARATLAAPKAEAWQPIATAPKDGTVVLLARDMGDFGFVRGFGHFDGEPGSFLSGWITQGFDPVTSNLGLAHPTLWQPLPRRPAPPTSPAPQEESK